MTCITQESNKWPIIHSDEGHTDDRETLFLIADLSTYRSVLCDQSPSLKFCPNYVEVDYINFIFFILIYYMSKNPYIRLFF